MATGNGNPQPAVAAGCAGKKERERYLDLLKGLAILFVILVHFNIACHCPVGIISKLTTIGARSPQLFFIISSFLIYRSCFGKDIDLWRFWKKRWIRLAPLYYAALVLFILFFKREMIVTDPLNIISHFLFLHGFNPHWIYGVIGVDWYVADIAIFYLIAPFLLRVVTNLKTSIVALFFGIITP